MYIFESNWEKANLNVIEVFCLIAYTITANINIFFLVLTFHFTRQSAKCTTLLKCHICNIIDWALMYLTVIPNWTGQVIFHVSVWHEGTIVVEDF